MLGDILQIFSFRDHAHQALILALNTLHILNVPLVPAPVNLICNQLNLSPSVHQPSEIPAEPPGSTAIGQYLKSRLSLKVVEQGLQSSELFGGRTRDKSVALKQEGPFGG